MTESKQSPKSNVTLAGNVNYTPTQRATLERGLALGLSRQQAEIAIETGITDIAEYARNLRKYGRGTR